MDEDGPALRDVQNDLSSYDAILCSKGLRPGTYLAQAKGGFLRLQAWD